MRQRLGLGIRKLRGKATLQLKFSLSYILVIAAVLILLNSYPLLVSQNMMVASNQNNLKSTAKVIESAMIGLEKLTVENVQAALEGLDESGAARIMVTNSAGLVLYDTRQGSNAVGEYALYSVVAVALRGQDASYCSYDGTAFLSRVATPVVYHNQIVGAVYAYDYDTEQSELLEAFRHNLLIISLLIALLVAGLSIVLSQMLTRQISGLLQAIRKVREGAYSHRADASGTDEIAQIAAEFNSLTDRLQTTENARRRFVSDASHELKTPLAGIRLLTDSILQTDHMDEETTKEFVTDIGREAERLSRITENLLRLTRLDSGVVQQPYPVAVRPVLERVERMLTMVAQEKGVTVSGAADEDAVALATDDDVHQILYNLMENAIKYSAAEDGFVRAEAHVDGDKVVLTVSDNGIGIPDEDLPHIFDRFYRVDKSRSKATGGAGLGLAIVKHIARIHNARIADNARRAVIGQGSGLQHIHAVVIDLSGNGHGQLGVGLPHRVAVAGQHRLIGQADALHRLFALSLAGGGRHLLDGALAALGHIGRIADVGVGGHRAGVAGHTGERIINFGERRHAQLLGDTGRDHVAHDLRVDQIGQLRDKIRHKFFSFSNPIALQGPGMPGPQLFCGCLFSCLPQGCPYPASYFFIS